MFCGYFTSEPVHNLADAMTSDRERFRKLFHGMLNEGVYLAPSQFEAGFLSTAHSAKGREWDAVFVIWAVDGYFPLSRALGSADQVDEEAAGGLAPERRKDIARLETILTEKKAKAPQAA